MDYIEAEEILARVVAENKDVEMDLAGQENFDALRTGLEAIRELIEQGWIAPGESI